MTLPRLTHLQALVLRLILKGRRAGQEIRSGLAAYGVAKSHPAFYELLARMEQEGLVEGEYRVVSESGQTARHRDYQLTRAGIRELKKAAAFYASDPEESHALRAA